MRRVKPGRERAHRARRLAGTDAVVLHDRRIPGALAHIDHIVVCPGGVTLIDPKDLKGDVRASARRAATLALRPGPLTDEEIRRVADGLRVRLPEA